ncbi:PorP/SprF family type IX secretion system membrane protein [Zobellia galactanivorans]|uniref:PorP/SprF family type IX secretion system membrane protein n=1 Tax=Zobellia galactanivorans (strain DSM 12802 / CCUG 47099 / CIP 106680 / NCIMB 13871 / Dsij) TaxID=63186 RepID=UPI001C068421|nr:type IX secretion system membrane protein PorP/SprF [Zobellia galactanivorans]MBU3025183.1 type IX secretion system membrane protein PorP/SprF [Zobellia galactanivorans]
MKKFLLAVLITISSFGGLSAQQDAHYTQYMYNTMAINPAYAGSRGVFSIAGLHRSQWVGIEGAPKTQTLNFHTPVSERVGVGLSIVNDDIGNGTSQETYFDGVFSYTVPITREAKLAFGLKASGHVLNLDFSKLANYNDEVASTSLTNIDRKFSPNFGAGVYYYDEKFYIGFSVPNFLATKHFDGNATSSSFLAKERMNFYLITGYIYELNQRWKFKPTLLLKAVNGAPLQIDLSANFMFNDKFILGAAYRWDAAVSGLFGFQASDQILLGLAYDREISELGGSRFNDGSFEIVLRYEFRSRFGRRAIAPRFF